MARVIPEAEDDGSDSGTAGTRASAGRDFPRGWWIAPMVVAALLFWIALVYVMLS